MAAIITLPDRTYAPRDYHARRRQLPYGMAHSAKMGLALAVDLLHRYTQPDQVILDPFGGIGTSLLGCVMEAPRHVMVVELEEKFCRAAWLNYQHLARNRLPGQPLGWAAIIRADSRALPLVIADDAVDSVLTSCPYGDLAARDRIHEGYARAHPALSARYGRDTPNRSVDGYGGHPAQIGYLPHVVLTSPPYERTITQGGETQVWQEIYGYQGDNQGYSRDPQNIGNLERHWKRLPQETYLEAVGKVYVGCWRVVRPGGLLVLVVGDYIRENKLIDLAGDTIALCEGIGWHLVERWRHRKAQFSFWRYLAVTKRRWAGAGQLETLALIPDEHILVFTKGTPAWDFAPLAPTWRAPAKLPGQLPDSPGSLPLPGLGLAVE